MSETTSEMQVERDELVAFLTGKTIAGLRFDAQPGGGFDLILSDGSELELYVISQRLTWVLMTAEEVAEQNARDLAAIAAQDARIAAGEERLYDHAEVWGEIEALEAEITGPRPRVGGQNVRFC